MITRTVFAICLIASLAAFAQDAVPEPADTGAARTVPGPRRYVITPSGTIVFPDAPPPTGDTSTFSGPGPHLSSGPVVGQGPEIGRGPVVGSEP